MDHPRCADSARTSWGRALLVATVAACFATELMFGVRALFEIRTLPERVLEWTLLFVPPELFESILGRFGADAKLYGLYGAVAGMLAVLVVLGTLLLRQARSPGWVIASGPLLYLLAMVGVMPLTGAGPFGSRLATDPWLVNVCYLAIGLTYGTTLLAGWTGRGGPDRAPHPTSTSETPSSATGGRLGAALAGRRALLTSAVATAVAFLLVARRGPDGGGGNDLPMARLDTLRQGADSAADAPFAPRLSSALPGPASDNSTRQAPRGEGGALTGAGREPGTLSDPITPAERFYKVTKNAVSDPMLQPQRWRLVVNGDIRSAVQLDYRTLLQAPSVEVVKTFECISNFTANCELPPYGCELISTAAWRGVRLGDLFGLAGGLKEV